MLNKAAQYPLHPFFIAMYPILFLLSVNAGQLPIQQSGRVLALSLFIAAILTLLAGALAKDIRRGALFCSIFLTLFFFYGHVYNGLQKSAPFFASRPFLLTLWSALLILGIWVSYKVRDISSVNKYLNFIALFLWVQPVLSIGFFVYKAGIPQEVAPPSPFDNIQVAAQASRDLPDIYYIILDAHGRSDIVKELFGYDNAPFIQHLEQKGFYVADQGRSNYIQTLLSISSALNFNYLNFEGMSSESTDRSPLNDLISNSELRQFLEKQGYQTVTFSTGYNTTTITDSDIVIRYKADKFFNSFEELLMTTSLVSALNEETQRELFVDPFKCEARRGYTLNIFENLKKIPELPGPKFIFAHVLSPHPPFIFDADGNPVEYGGCRVNDGDYFIGTHEDYLAGYPRQLAYTDKMIQETIDIILEKSANPPVIIIQGDHGSGMYLRWDSVRKTCMRERGSILNAYYIPDQKYDQLYETITPINSFRVVLNEVFKLDLPLLEDKTYYSGWYTPYQLIDVTDKFEDSCKVGN